jgi:hypothetical protein
MRYLLLLCSAGLLSGQGSDPKRSAEDYEVHAQAKDAAIGAEFTVHSFSRGEAMFVVQDFLVLEVAIFPPKGATLEIHNTDFVLRINGRKQLLEAAAPTLVVADRQHPEWRQPDPTVQASAGINNTGVTIGGPPVNRNPFPGSQTPGTGTRTYPPVEIPRDNPSGVQKEPVDAAELLLQTALVEGPHHSATSGFLYFPFRGKVSSIKTLELLYRDGELKLR